MGLCGEWRGSGIQSISLIKVSAHCNIQLKASIQRHLHMGQWDIQSCSFKELAPGLHIPLHTVGYVFIFSTPISHYQDTPLVFTRHVDLAVVFKLSLARFTQNMPLACCVGFVHRLPIWSLPFGYLPWDVF